MTTVKNVSLDYIRRQDIRSRYVLASMKETEMVVNSVYDHWDVHEEKIKAIMGALTELTPRTQQIVQLCYVEHKKYREVAAELDISESAVKNISCRHSVICGKNSKVLSFTKLNLF